MDEDEDEEILEEGFQLELTKEHDTRSKKKKPLGKSLKRKRGVTDEPEEDEPEPEEWEATKGSKVSVGKLSSVTNWKKKLPKGRRWVPTPRALYPNQAATKEQAARATKVAEELLVKTTWPPMEVWDMAYQMLQISVDLVSYSLVTYLENGYPEATAALWGGYKHRTVRHRDMAMMLAVSSVAEGATEAEVFVRAAEMLERYGHNEGLNRASIELVRKGRTIKTWRDSEMKVEPEYELGKRSSSTKLRVVVRQLGEKLDNFKSHLTYLIGEDLQLREHAVLGDGHCWLRCVLMQLPKSYHGTKPWNEENGELMMKGGTSALVKRVDRGSGSGAILYGCLEREVMEVAEGVANFINENPIAYHMAEERFTTAGTCIPHTTLDPAKRRYEFHQAKKLYKRAENYLRLNHPEKENWLITMRRMRGTAPDMVLHLIACWSVSSDAALELLKRFNDGEWGLVKSIGMVKKRGETGTVEFQDYVAEILPFNVFVQEESQEEEGETKGK